MEFNIYEVVTYSPTGKERYFGVDNAVNAAFQMKDERSLETFIDMLAEKEDISIYSRIPNHAFTQQAMTIEFSDGSTRDYIDFIMPQHDEKRQAERLVVRAHNIVKTYRRIDAQEMPSLRKYFKNTG